MTFDEWWGENGIEWEWTILEHDAKALWAAAQQAERERIKNIIKQFSSECNEDGEWVRCCDELLEEIDVPE